MNIFHISLNFRPLATCCFIKKSHIKYLNHIKVFVQPYSFNAQQRSNLARKFLQKEVNFKQNFDQSTIKKVPTSSNPYRKKKPTVNISRHLVKLDKIYLEKITDLFSTAEYATEILENRIEITKVQVQIGFSAIYVFWTSPDSKVDEKINNLFIKIAPLLRHELKQLNVFGQVPPIKFIKDVTCDLMADIDKRLALADFGEDYEPTNTAHHIIIENTLYKRLKEDLWNNLNEKSMEVSSKEVDLHDDGSLPKFEYHIFGLHRDKIINSVMREMKSSKGEHRNSKEEMDMEHQRRFVSPIIVKSSSFMQVDGARASNIRQWANEFNRKKRKLMKEMTSDYEECPDLEENYNETNFNSGDMVDFDENIDEHDLNDYEPLTKKS